MKDFNKILKNKIRQLPQHEPKSEVWDTLNADLQFRNKLKIATHQLSDKEPSELLWTKIENKLTKTITLHRTKTLIIGLSAAASVAILIVTYFLYQNSKQGEITVREEIVNEWDTKSSIDEDPSTRNAIQFIEEHCQQNNFVCNIPDFTKKKQKLDEINNQIKEINLIINTTGSSPSIEKSLIKLENVRASLVKDLINQLTS